MKNQISLLILLIFTIFIAGCGIEQYIFPTTKSIDLELLVSNNTPAQTQPKNNTQPFVKSIIPLEFASQCEFNSKILFYDTKDPLHLCKKDDFLMVTIKNTGFDPVTQVKLSLGENEYIQSYYLEPEKIKKYRFYNVTFNNAEIYFTPRSEFFDKKNYDCIQNKIKFKVSNILSCN